MEFRFFFLVSLCHGCVEFFFPWFPKEPQLSNAGHSVSSPADLARLLVEDEIAQGISSEIAFSFFRLQKKFSNAQRGSIIGKAKWRMGLWSNLGALNWWLLLLSAAIEWVIPFKMGVSCIIHSVSLFIAHYFYFTLGWSVYSIRLYNSRYYTNSEMQWRHYFTAPVHQRERLNICYALPLIFVERNATALTIGLHSDSRNISLFIWCVWYVWINLPATVNAPSSLMEWFVCAKSRARTLLISV